MANEGNLIPANKRSKSEVRENSRKGGIESGEVRRKKKTTKMMAKTLLDACPKLTEKAKLSLQTLGIDADEEMTGRFLSMVSIMQKALNGDIKALEKMLELSGEKSEKAKVEFDKLKEQKEYHDKQIEIDEKRLELEKMKLMNGGTDEDEEGLIINYDYGVPEQQGSEEPCEK